MLDVTAFLDRFPAFSRTDHALIEAKLAEAAVEMDASVWGDKYDLGLGYLAASLLDYSSPGQNARLVPANAKATRDDALNVYERKYRELRRQVVHGFRVTGAVQSDGS